jgi:hypothetical protein
LFKIDVDVWRTLATIAEVRSRCVRRAGGRIKMFSHLRRLKMYLIEKALFFHLKKLVCEFRTKKQSLFVVRSIKDHD